MKVGYCRVSTTEQTTALQRDALERAGCERIFEDTMSGTTTSRPALDEAMATVQEGDVLVVYRLDRLGRSLPHLIETVESLRRRNVGFASVSEAIDTTTPAGRLFLHILASLAQFERELLIERTHAGIKAAKARGTHCGRRRALGWEQLALARQLLAQGQTQRQVARVLKISDRTLSRRLREAA